MPPGTDIEVVYGVRHHRYSKRQTTPKDPQVLSRMEFFAFLPLPIAQLVSAEHARQGMEEGNKEGEAGLQWQQDEYQVQEWQLGGKGQHRLQEGQCRGGSIPALCTGGGDGLVCHRYRVPRAPVRPNTRKSAHKQTRATNN